MKSPAGQASGAETLRAGDTPREGQEIKSASSALAIATDVALHTSLFVGQLARTTVGTTPHKMLMETMEALGRRRCFRSGPSGRSRDIYGQFLLDPSLLFQVALDGLADGIGG